MARYFKNPESDQVEEVGDFQVLAMVFIPVLYLLFAGLWRHALIWVAMIGLACFMAPPLSAVPVIGVYVFYCLRIRQIVAAEYLKKGWQEVPEPAKPTRNPTDV